MFDELRTNLILLLLNIIALANFAYPVRNQFLIIFSFFLIIPLPYQIKIKMRIITILSLLSSFIINQTIGETFCVIALGLAVNTAYQLDLTEGPSLINAALGLTQIFSFWQNQNLEKNSINRDICLLIFALPNLFISCKCQIIKSKRLFLINPFLDGRWLYASGFVLGIFTASLISIHKHYKFFCIALIILLQVNVQKIEVAAGALSFIRGILIYTQRIHESQRYFLIGYLVVKIFFQRYLFYFMFIGYLIIGVILYKEHSQRKDLKKMKKDEAVGTQEEIDYEMSFSNMIEMKTR